MTTGCAVRSAYASYNRPCATCGTAAATAPGGRRDDVGPLARRFVGDRRGADDGVGVTGVDRPVDPGVFDAAEPLDTCVRVLRDGDGHELVLLDAYVVDVDLGGRERTEPCVDLRRGGGGQTEDRHEGADSQDRAQAGEYGPGGTRDAGHGTLDTRARAMAARCRTPPDSRVGSASSRCPRPTCSSASWARRRRSGRAVPLWTRASWTFSRVLRCGSRWKDWNTNSHPELGDVGIFASRAVMVICSVLECGSDADVDVHFLVRASVGPLCLAEYRKRGRCFPMFSCRRVRIRPASICLSSCISLRVLSSATGSGVAVSVEHEHRPYGDHGEVTAELDLLCPWPLPPGPLHPPGGLQALQRGRRHRGRRTSSAIASATWSTSSSVL